MKRTTLVLAAALATSVAAGPATADTEGAKVCARIGQGTGARLS